jgi:GTP-binding protein Era
VLSDLPARFFAAEMVREQLFEQLDREMPYRVAVVVDEYDESGRTTRIEASIYTDTDSSRGIIIGKGGRQIKAIGIAARRNIEELTGQPVHLALHVRVKKDWQDDPGFLEDLGI